MMIQREIEGPDKGSGGYTARQPSILDKCFLQYLDDRIDILEKAHKRYKVRESEETDRITRIAMNSTAAHMLDTVAEMKKVKEEFVKIYQL